MKTRLLITGFCVLLLWYSRLEAQEASVSQVFYYSTSKPEEAVLGETTVGFSIQEVIITGNKRTRRSTIIRELAFVEKQAYPLPEIIEKLEQTKRQLMNTGLFRRVEVTLRSLKETDVFITVDVEERWYFFPEPFVRVANGSFSQWSERGRPLEHLNYGINLTQLNFSGRGDKMHVHLANGYTKKVSLQYRDFYLDKDLKWSSSINLTHGKNREMNYATENNKLLPVRNPDGFLFEFFQSSVDVMYRPAIKTKHTFSAGYNYNRMADTISKLNALYANGDDMFAFPYVTYGVSFIDFDFNPYPTRGRRGDVSIHKAGFGGAAINLWQLAVKGTNYWPLGSRSFFSLHAGGTIKLPFEQPYVTQGFLGYGDNFLQGYENYIIDGVAGGFTKATIGYNVLKTDIPVPRNRFVKSIRSIPLQAFVKLYGNAGYAYNPNLTLRNALNNRMLYSSGLGLDIIVFANTVFKFEWSFNQLGQNALYLH